MALPGADVSQSANFDPTAETMLMQAGSWTDEVISRPAIIAYEQFQESTRNATNDHVTIDQRKFAPSSYYISTETQGYQVRRWVGESGKESHWTGIGMSSKRNQNTAHKAEEKKV